LGAGLAARAVTLDLVRQDDVEEVRVVDSRPEPLRKLKSSLHSAKVRTTRLDVRDRKSLVRLLEPYTAAVSCIPYFLNLELARTAVAARCHFCDLGGSNEVVRAELALGPKARRAGVAVVPDCGLAPGLVSILTADGIARLVPTDGAQVRTRRAGCVGRAYPLLSADSVWSSPARSALNSSALSSILTRRRANLVAGAPSTVS
jgi:lysine 6-dehydrogenase